MTTLLKGYLHASLILRITIALVLGVAVGLVGGEWVDTWLSPLGDLLLRLLTFLIVPIVLFTLMVGVNQTQEGGCGAYQPQGFGLLPDLIGLRHRGGALRGHAVEPGE